MILRFRGLLLVGIATCVIGLVTLFPARVAYHWFAPPGVALTAIEGSLWNGRAAALGAAGLYLRDLEWRLRPWYAFTGELRFAVKVAPAVGFIDGDLQLGLGRAVTIYGEQLRGAVPLDLFADSTNIRGLSGNATLQLEQLKVRNGRPLVIDGRIEVADLVAPMVSRESIGGYRAEFSTQSSAIIASVEDTDGSVDLAGSLELRNDGTYTFLGQVVPKAGAPERLKQQMQYLGSRNDRGQYELRVDGEI